MLTVREYVPVPGSMTVPEGLLPFARMADLPRAGTALFFYDTGAGAGDRPVLLLVHGLGDEADSWRKVIVPLSARFRVIAPDLPGFGRSPLPEGPSRRGRRPATRSLKPVWLATLLGELLDGLGSRRVYLCGNSLGAILAQLVAIGAPGRVGGLVLADGALPANPLFLLGFGPMLVPGRGERIYAALRGHPEAAYDSLRGFYADLARLSPEDRTFLADRVVARVESGTQMTAYFSLLRSCGAWLSLHGRAARRRFARLGLPLLIVWGAEDRVMPRSIAEGARTPGSRFELVAAAGHLPQQEAPERFVELVCGIQESGSV